MTRPLRPSDITSRRVTLTKRGRVVLPKLARAPTRRALRRAKLATLPVREWLHADDVITVAFANWRVLGPNRSEHHMSRSRRVNREHDRMVAAFMLDGVRPALPVVVTLYRFGKRAMDRDNMIAGLKSARDCVADWLGVDDADPRVEWRYVDGKLVSGGYEFWMDVEPRDAAKGAKGR